MKIGDLNIDELAPRKGQILAYTRKKVLFEAYEDLSNIKDMLKDIDLLEIHLFDKEKEYRAVLASKRHKLESGIAGIIEHLSEFADDMKEVYKESILLEDTYKDYGSITVLNHINYDKLGMAKIDDYRLIMEEQI